MAGVTIPRSLDKVLGRSSSVSTTGVLPAVERGAAARRRAPRTSRPDRSIWQAGVSVTYYDGAPGPNPSLPLPSSGTWQITAYVYINWAEALGSVAHNHWTITCGHTGASPVYKPGGLSTAWADYVTFEPMEMAGGTLTSSYSVVGDPLGVGGSPFPWRLGLSAWGVRV